MAINTQEQEIDITGAVPVGSKIILPYLDGIVPTGTGFVRHALPEKGFYLSEENITAMKASVVNNSYVWDNVSAQEQEWVWVSSGSTNMWSYPRAIVSLMHMYLVNEDEAYLNLARDTFVANFITNPFVDYQGANQIRGTAPHCMYGYALLRNHLTDEQNAFMQAEFNTWSEYWLHEDHFYDGNFETSFRSSDSDHASVMMQIFLQFALVLDDASQAAKCEQLFWWIYQDHNKAEGLFIRGMLGGHHPEGSKYTANSIKYILHTFWIMREHTDLEIPMDFIKLTFRALLDEHLNMDNPERWWHGDVEGVTGDVNPMNEGRYMDVLELYITLLKGEPEEAEAIYIRNMMDTRQRHNFAEFALPAIDTTVAPVKPTPSITYTSFGGMNINTFRDSFEVNNTILTTLNSYSRFDHQEWSPMAWRLFYKGKAVSTSMICYGNQMKPQNVLQVRNHAEREDRNPTGWGQRGQFYDACYILGAEGDATYGLVVGEFSHCYNKDPEENNTYSFVNQATKSVYIDFERKYVLAFGVMITDPESYSDMKYPEPVTSTYAREHRNLHRFNSKVAPTLSNGVWTDIHNGIEQKYQSALPFDSEELIDESTHIDYEGLSDNGHPELLEYFHLRQNYVGNDAKFLDITQYGDEGTVVALNQTTLNVAQGNVTALLLDSTILHIFNNNPEVPITDSIVVDAPTGITDVIIDVITGSYDITRNGGQLTVAAGSAYASSSQNVIKIKGVNL